MENYNQNQTFTNYTVVGSQPYQGAVGKKFMANVFSWMFAGLGLTAAIAFVFGANPEWMYAIVTNGLTWPVMLAPLGFVLLMSFGFNRLSAPAIVGLFLAYSAINGISLSFIFLVFQAGSIAGCFVASGAMFGVMAFMGYTTDKDLTSFGRILMMGLIGIVVAMLVNFFMHSDGLSYLISIIGVVVFTGLTAYDTQVLKRIGAGVEYEGTSANDTKKLAIMGALRLYLDFINLFLMLLRLFGRRR
jgi:uncharacterized protein